MENPAIFCALRRKGLPERLVSFGLALCSTPDADPIMSVRPGPAGSGSLFEVSENFTVLLGLSARGKYSNPYAVDF